VEATHIEPRWPVVVAILAVLSLQALLPDRIRAFPSWVPFLLAIILIVPMVALTLTSAKVDYLFLAFSTATAFSATDDLPLTARAKLLMMLESVFSLVTIITVAARAINILGSEAGA